MHYYLKGYILCVVDMANHGYTDKDRSKSRLKQLKALQLMILLLPRENAILLECLLDLLHSAASVTENKMSASSLGVVFGPSLLCPRKVKLFTFISATLKKAVHAMIWEQSNDRLADALMLIDQILISVIIPCLDSTIQIAVHKTLDKVLYNFCILGSFCS